MASDGGVVDQRLDLIQRLDHVVEFLAVDAGCSNLLNPRRLFDHEIRLVSQTGQHHVPVVETFAARIALRRVPVVTAIALITFLAADPLVTHARSSFSVALLAGGAGQIAITRVTLDIRIAPVVGLTLVATSSTETRSTLASAVVWITPVEMETD